MDNEKSSDDKSPVLAYVVKKFFDQFAQQANNQNNLLIEITRTTDASLQYINDDCLLEIFSMKSLSLIDLCSLAETCSRFQHITQRIFPKKFNIEIWKKKYYDVVSTNSTLKESRALDIERIFKNFGSILTEISISSMIKRPSNFVLNVVTEYSVNTLQSLMIENFIIAEVLGVKLKPIFKRLQRLELKYVSIASSETLFADWNSLIELRIIDVINFNCLLGNIFPKLELFTCYWTDYKPQPSLSTFIRRHTKLKILDLHLLLDGSNKIDILQAIGTSCAELEKLKVRIRSWSKVFNSSYFLPLQALKHLRTLELGEEPCEDFKFVPAMTGLRELNLFYCIPPTNYNQFDFLTQLTKLQIFLRRDSGSFDVVDIIKRLVNLEQLILLDPWPQSTNDVFNEETFSKIVRIVKDRLNVLTIHCQFQFSYNSKDRAENEIVKLILIDDLRKLPPI